MGGFIDNMKNETKDVEKSADVFVCKECGDEHDTGDERKNDEGELFCEECFEDLYTCCYDCDAIILRDDAIGFYDGVICDYCERNNWHECNGCGELTRNGESCGDDYCESNDSLPTRDYYSGDRFCVNNERAYSCEVECYYPSMRVMHDIAQEIPDEIGIVSDGSLDDDGVEFNTPKLSGKVGANMLKDFIKVLNDNDFYVNSACGLHIHLDSVDVMNTKFAPQKLMLFYMVFEDVIMSFLPLSRRDNTYCLPITEFYHINEIKNCNSIEELESIWYRKDDTSEIRKCKNNKYDQSRYAGINFHSLLANKHIEIRYHSGTINYHKIMNWIKLHVAILDRIVESQKSGNENKIDLNTLLKIRFKLGLKEKTESFFDYLNLSDEVKKYFLDRQKTFSGDLLTNENE